eukprot:14176870-Alexandrium_andersonii.AAC.1
MLARWPEGPGGSGRPSVVARRECLPGPALPGVWQRELGVPGAGDRLGQGGRRRAACCVRLLPGGRIRPWVLLGS